MYKQIEISEIKKNNFINNNNVFQKNPEKVKLEVYETKFNVNPRGNKIKESKKKTL